MRQAATDGGGGISACLRTHFYCSFQKIQSEIQNYKDTNLYCIIITTVNADRIRLSENLQPILHYTDV